MPRLGEKVALVTDAFMDTIFRFLLLLVLLILPIGYAAYLQLRFTRPYRLLRASSKEKWIWAAQTSFFFLLPFLLFGLMSPLLKVDENDPWVTALVCTGVWIIAYPILLLVQMASFAHSLNVYKGMNRTMKQFQNMGKDYQFPDVRLDQESKQFFREGFPDEPSEDEQQN